MMKAISSSFSTNYPDDLSKRLELPVEPSDRLKILSELFIILAKSFFPDSKTYVALKALAKYKPGAGDLIRHKIDPQGYSYLTCFISC